MHVAHTHKNKRNTEKRPLEVITTTIITTTTTIKTVTTTNYRNITQKSLPIQKIKRKNTSIQIFYLIDECISHLSTMYVMRPTLVWTCAKNIMNSHLPTCLVTTIKKLTVYIFDLIALISHSHIHSY